MHNLMPHCDAMCILCDVEHQLSGCYTRNLQLAAHLADVLAIIFRPRQWRVPWHLIALHGILLRVICDMCTLLRG